MSIEPALLSEPADPGKLRELQAQVLSRIETLRVPSRFSFLRLQSFGAPGVHNVVAIFEGKVRRSTKQFVLLPPIASIKPNAWLIARPVLIARAHVTCSEWGCKVVSFGHGGKRPHVDTFEALASFAREEGYSLPTQSVWDAAAKAGIKARFYCGADLIGHAWCTHPGASIEDSPGEPCDVGRFPPNHVGLLDIHGNSYDCTVASGGRLIGSGGFWGSAYSDCDVGVAGAAEGVEGWGCGLRLAYQLS